MALNIPQSNKESTLDKIAKGLQVANGVLGVVGGVQSIRKSSAEMDALDEGQRRIKEGILTPKEQLEYSKDYAASDVESPGSFKLKTHEGKDIYYSPKDKMAAKGAAALTQKDVADFQDKGFAIVPAGAKGSTLYSAYGPDGQVKQIGLVPPTRTDPAKEPKDVQTQAALYGKRMEQSEGVFQELASKGYDPTSAGSGAQRTTVFGVGLPERFKSEDVKRQEQAERNFVNAVLRKESGAAISHEEFDSASKQYFPRPGDTEEVLKQKAENRALAIAGMKTSAGPAWAAFKQPGVAQGYAAVKKAPSEMTSNAMAGQGGFSAEDVEALKWAKSNQKDPRAKQILLRLKGKGL